MRAIDLLAQIGVQIAAMCLVAAGSLVAQTAAPVGGNAMAGALRPSVGSHQIAGAVTAVADADGLLDVSTVGEADIAEHRPMRDDTLFWIASQSKPIAATALMMLVDEGKVNLDDPIEKNLGSGSMKSGSPSRHG